MPIVALPSATVRAIGSTSIISDPYSLAKELLDNALDALATSVSIEISQDTVGLLQVKDNGHGIPADDYTVVCKRTFTSKIHTVEDLQKVGGKSLGFRGEALASAAEISGALTVSTRVETDPVGSSLEYDRNGELIRTERISHPVGTTVRISNLFQQIPVRRQTAIKNFKKTLLKIKKMMQAYAMARPSVRLSFKVLKAKTESSNWMYAPGKNSTLTEAALKVAGTDVASNCVLKNWPTSSNDGRTSPEGSVFRLAALLPKLGSDFTKFNNLGQYISVDNRPLSSGRGVAQSITRLYKTYVRSAASRDGLSPRINDPFLCIHILCPEGAYDANVEPSKDDVLFEDQQAVLSLMEDLLRNTYGDLPDVHADHGLTEQNRGMSQRNGFETLLSRKQQKSALAAPALASGPQERNFVSARSFAHPEPRPSPPVPHSREEQADRSSLSQPHILRASIANESPGVDAQGQRRSSPYRETHLPKINTSPRETRQGDDARSCLPSPISNADSLTAAMNTASPSSLGPSQLSPTTAARNMRHQQRQIDRERYGNRSLDTWFVKLSRSSQSPAPTEKPGTQVEDSSLTQLTQDCFDTERACLNGTSDLTINPSQAASEISLPYSIADSSSTEGPSRTIAQLARFVNKPGLPVLEQWSARLYSAADPDENPELQKALEFETKKKAAVQERRMQLQDSKATTSRNSPHQSRYLAARAALSSQPKPSSATQQSRSGLGEISSNGTRVSKTVLNPHDPRAYLMHLQNSDVPNGSKLKQITSAKLPFERIPEGYDLHSVGLTLPAGPSLICASFKEFWDNDLYTQSGDQAEGFLPPDIDTAIKSWNARLSRLIRAHYRLTESSGIPNIQFDFSDVFRLSRGSD
ncbi:hypothetical protein BDW72DRAFT_192316 [Aspergillus terricola var. indicus]